MAKRDLRQRLQVSAGLLFREYVAALMKRGVLPAKAEEQAQAMINRGIARVMERLTTGKNK